MGGISGAATFGIGELFKAGNLLAKLSETAQLFTQSGLHGISQGFFGMFDGGNFFQGFVAGALGSLGAKGWTKTFGSGTGGMIAFGAVSGGVGAELSGGNFFKGFLQGGIVAGLNDAAHIIAIDNKFKAILIENNIDPHKPVANVEALMDLLKKIFADVYNSSSKDVQIANVDNVKSFNDCLPGANLSLVAGQLYNNNNPVNGVTEMYRSGSMIISPHRLLQALNFTTTWYHEMHHSRFFNSGIYNLWLSVHGDSEARKLNEFFAYSSVVGLGGDYFNSSLGMMENFTTNVFLYNYKFP